MSEVNLIRDNPLAAMKMADDEFKETRDLNRFTDVYSCLSSLKVHFLVHNQGQHQLHMDLHTLLRSQQKEGQHRALSLEKKSKVFGPAQTYSSSAKLSATVRYFVVCFSFWSGRRDEEVQGYQQQEHMWKETEPSKTLGGLTPQGEAKRLA